MKKAEKTNSNIWTLVNKYKYLIVTLILVFLFFSYSVTYTYDSFHYLNYVDILKGNVPFSTWDIVRGPSFPVTIYIFNFLFGDNQNSHLILQFISFAVLILIVHRILNTIVDDFKYKKIINMVLVILIVCNPIIFGYYHVLLTEFLAITITMLSIYLAFKWINAVTKKQKIIYVIIFALLLSYMWFLKQPYAVSVMAPLLVACLVSIIKKRSINNIIYRIGTVVVSLLFMVLTISLWNIVLINHNVNMNTGRDSGSILASTMLGLNSYKLVDSSSTNYYNLNEDEINNIKNEKYVVLLTFKDDQVIDKDFIKVVENKISISNVLLISIQNCFQNPTVIIPEYADNYCAVSSVCKVATDDGTIYRTTKGKDYLNLFENDTIGYRIYKNEIEQNAFYVPENFAVNKQKYSVYKNAGAINSLFKKAIPITNILYKSLILICPLFFIISIVLLLIAKKKNNKLVDKCVLLLICVSYAFTYLLADTYIGAIIDRYSVEAFIPLFISLIAIIYIIVRIINDKKISRNN